MIHDGDAPFTVLLKSSAMGRTAATRADTFSCLTFGLLAAVRLLDCSSGNLRSSCSVAGLRETGGVSRQRPSRGGRLSQAHSRVDCGPEHVSA